MPDASRHRLSKSRVVAGAQCAKLLWWRVHESDAPELVPDALHEALFQAGHRVGAAAQACFPGGVEVAYTSDLSTMLEHTQLQLERDVPAIFEASFVHDGVFVAVDILERSGDGWTVIEVKSTKSVKAHHILDAAVQVHVLRAAGLKVVGAQLMHLHPRASAEVGLFARADILERVESLLPGLPELIEGLGTVLSGPLPEVPVGRHCRQPRACAFLERCSPRPAPDATARLYRISKKALQRLHSLGHDTVHTIPADYPLKPIADRQRRSLTTDSLILDPGLGQALDQIRMPAVFIDFESIAPPIPPFEGLGPYAQIPVQVSCHRVEVDGSVSHTEWLGISGEDPRPGLAAAVHAACSGAETLVAYSAGFEKQMIRHLSEHCSEAQAPALLALCDRFVDLLPIMRGFVYHPEFGGRFGLKAVTAALLPELAYGDLEVRAGGQASILLADLILYGEPADPSAQEALRADLLAYCKRDTETLVALLRRLRAEMESRASGA
jgi:hypothetical protein